VNGRNRVWHQRRTPHPGRYALTSDHTQFEKLSPMCSGAKMAEFSAYRPGLVLAHIVRRWGSSMAEFFSKFKRMSNLLTTCVCPIHPRSRLPLPISNAQTGDSLTRHMTTTLASVLGAKAISLHKLQDQWQACEGQLRLRFVRNDHLDPIDDDDARCQNVATDDTLREFDTLVVNSGAMPRPALEYGRQMEAAAEALASAMCTERWVAVGWAGRARCDRRGKEAREKAKDPGSGGR